MLSYHHRALVRETWALVAPIKSQAAALFYQRLFELDPSLRTLFAHSDMDTQGTKLMQMLDVAVAQLDKPDVLIPAVEALGRRHNGYGVRAEHYGTVAQSLLWTLEQGLGPAFTPEARDAWTLTYGALARAMQRPAVAAA
jgi:hemoglobin-like flavoprotein